MAVEIRQIFNKFLKVKLQVKKRRVEFDGFQKIHHNFTRHYLGWVTTYGPGFGEVQKIVTKVNETLVNSPIFSDMGVPVLGVVARRAPNLRDLLYSQRSICLNPSRGSVTTRCTAPNAQKRGRPCEACNLMSEESVLTIGNISYTCAGGDCNAFNINYGAQCTHCHKGYIGKTVQPLRSRISEHRNTLNDKLDIKNIGDISDDNTLAAHAIEHDIRTKVGFNRLYRFYIIRYVEQENITKSEQFFYSLINLIH